MELAIGIGPTLRGPQSLAELARLMGTTQTAISRIENVNYSAWNIKTLKKLARALHVRLKVSFENYGTLPDEVLSFWRDNVEREVREHDPGLWSNAPAETIREAVAANQQKMLAQYTVHNLRIVLSRARASARPDQHLAGHADRQLHEWRVVCGDLAHEARLSQ